MTLRLHLEHLEEFCPKERTVIHAFMVLAAMKGVDQHIKQFSGSVSCPRTHRHADQGNRTSDRLITRCWLYS